MELSKRLQAVASLVEEGDTIADIGTDHAYIPIQLIQRGTISFAIAMDIHKGPLERAAEHVRMAELEKKIELRLSDGFEKLSPHEVDCAVLAGMGGGLVIKILKEHMEVTRSLKTCILQPQSEIAKVRAFLIKEGFLIIEEEMVCEDGKYYPMMKVVTPETDSIGSETQQRSGEKQRKSSEIPGAAPIWDEVQLRFGKLLLEKKHPVLRQLLQRDLKLTEEILKNLPSEGGERIENRKTQLNQEIGYIREGLKYYEM